MIGVIFPPECACAVAPFTVAPFATSILRSGRPSRQVAYSTGVYSTETACLLALDSGLL